MIIHHHLNKYTLALFAGLALSACGDDGSNNADASAEGRMPASYQVDLEKANITLADEEIVAQAAQGNFRRVRTMIENKTASINSVDKFGVTPLMAAANNGREDTVELLLDYIEEGNSKLLDAGDSNGKTALYYAVELRRPEILEALLEHGANPNLYSNEGVFPLHKSVMQGEIGILQVLLDGDHGGILVNPNVQDLDGRTPLMLALQKGNKEIIDILLESGADIEAVDNAGMTALMYAVASNSKDMVGYLLQKKAKINTLSEAGLTALIVALQNANFEMSRHLLIKGADPSVYKSDKKSPLEIAVSYKNSEVVLVNALLGKLAQTGNDLPSGALLSAIQPGNIEVVRLLLDSGADVQALEGAYNNALIRALAVKDEPIAMLVVQEGADVNKLDKDGYSPFAMAIKENYLELGALLLEKGAMLEPKTKNPTAIPLNIILQSENVGFLDLFLSKSEKISANKLLIQAVVESKTKLVPTILEYDANPDVSDSLGKPVLWLAVAKSNTEIVKALLEAGAEVNIRDAQKGATPLMIAVAAKNAQMVQYLLAARANPNIADAEGLSATSYAILTDQPGVLKLLVDGGADVNARDDRGHDLGYVVENSQLNKLRKQEMMLLLGNLGFEG